MLEPPTLVTPIEVNLFGEPLPFIILLGEWIYWRIYCLAYRFRLAIVSTIEGGGCWITLLVRPLKATFFIPVALGEFNCCIVLYLMSLWSNWARGVFVLCISIVLLVSDLRAFDVGDAKLLNLL